MALWESRRKRGVRAWSVTTRRGGGGGSEEKAVARKRVAARTVTRSAGPMLAAGKAGVQIRFREPAPLRPPRIDERRQAWNGIPHLAPRCLADFRDFVGKRRAASGSDPGRRRPCPSCCDHVRIRTSLLVRCVAAACGDPADRVSRNARRIHGTRNPCCPAACRSPRGWGRRAYVERRGVAAPRWRGPQRVCRQKQLASAFRCRGERKCDVRVV